VKKDFIEGVHYYLDQGKVVFTEKYHLDRGYCCGKGCRHCPFTDPKRKGNTTVKLGKKDKN
jgi:hypothetical protein